MGNKVFDITDARCNHEVFDITDARCNHEVFDIADARCNHEVFDITDARCNHEVFDITDARCNLEVSDITDARCNHEVFDITDARCNLEVHFSINFAFFSFFLFSCFKLRTLDKFAFWVQLLTLGSYLWVLQLASGKWDIRSGRKLSTAFIVLPQCQTWFNVRAFRFAYDVGLAEL